MTAPVSLAAELIGAVVDAAKFSPRSRQVAIGPSEIGHPCQRRLAYKLTETRPTWVDSDPWASIVGTACHAWLASAFSAQNLVLDEPRWLVEQRVHPTPGISGSCDLYDTYTDTVIDWKIVGTTTMAKAKSQGASQQYRTQGHLYGLGWERLGRTPREIVIAYWPRGGFLSQLYLYREPYNRQVAEDALDRLTRISAAALSLGVDEHPERTNLVPCQPSDECRYCPYRSATRGDGGCPDAPTKATPTGVPGITE